MLENVRTGEIIEFVVETPELLQLEVTWTKPGLRAVQLLDEYRREVVLAPARIRDVR